jgi:hypothetical protein
MALVASALLAPIPLVTAFLVRVLMGPGSIEIEERVGFA